MDQIRNVINFNTTPSEITYSDKFYYWKVEGHLVWMPTNLSPSSKLYYVGPFLHRLDGPAFIDNDYALYCVGGFMVRDCDRKPDIEYIWIQEGMVNIQ